MSDKKDRRQNLFFKTPIHSEICSVQQKRGVMPYRLFLGLAAGSAKAKLFHSDICLNCVMDILHYFQAFYLSNWLFLSQALFCFAWFFFHNCNWNLSCCAARLYLIFLHNVDLENNLFLSPFASFSPITFPSRNPIFFHSFLTSNILDI